MAGESHGAPAATDRASHLDWSHGLLSNLERVVLRRLTVFVGYFTFDAALEVVTSPSLQQDLVFGAIDSLVAKSMVAARPVGAMMRYRLLDTTRAYAREIAVDTIVDADLTSRHATYYRRWLEQSGTEWPTLSNAAERAPHLAGLGNVSAALEWCFGIDGNAQLGFGLAAAAAPVFLALSLLTECRRWSEQALHALDDSACGGREGMGLQAALGMSLMFLAGQTEAARAALARGLVIAEECHDPASQLQLLGPLHMFHLRSGDYQAALRHAERSAAVAETMDNPAAVALTHSLLGIALHLSGDLETARRQLEAALRHEPGARRTRSLYLGFDHHNWASIALARTLWLQGHPAQAVERARRSVENAAGMDHPVTLSITLNWAVSVLFWAGDLESAEDCIDRFISHAGTHSLGPYLAVGHGFRGAMAIRRGDADSGIESLRACLAALQDAVGLQAILEPDLAKPTAAIHVWTSGTFGIMTPAVMTRAIRGHSGKPLHAGGLEFTLLTLLLLGTLARLTAPYADGMMRRLPELAALGWMLAYLGFLFGDRRMLFVLPADPDEVRRSLRRSGSYRIERLGLDDRSKSGE